MRFLRHCLLLLSLALACKPAEEPVEPVVPDKPDEPVSYGFIASPSSLAFPGEGGTLTFRLTTDASWKSSCEASWVSWRPTAGRGNDEISVTLQANPDVAKSRSATIVFEVDGAGTGRLTVTVTQAPSDPMDVEVSSVSASDISFSSASLSAAYRGATDEVRELGFEWGPDPSALSEVLQADVADPQAASGSISATLTGLGDGKTYSVRAYVTLQRGDEIVTFRGDVESFTTQVSAAPSATQPGWAELPAMSIDILTTPIPEDRYMVNRENASQYFAWHVSPDVHGPGGRLARNYTVCFDADAHCPLWVAAPRHSMYVGNSGRTEAYGPDPDIPAEYQYFSKSTGGGCNKGHMLGSAERTCSKGTNQQVFYYSNIAPQLSAGFNTGGGGWNILEDYVDTQVCADTLYEVLGCYFKKYTDAYGKTQEPATITFGGRNDVSMPTMFYYVLLRTKDGNSGKSVVNCSAAELKCAAFVRTHTNDLKGQKVTAKEMMSVADLEKITGITYFPGVPNAPKSSFKAEDWGVPKQ